MQKKRPAEVDKTADSDDDLLVELLSPELQLARKAMNAKLAHTKRTVEIDSSGAADASSSRQDEDSDEDNEKGHDDNDDNESNDGTEDEEVSFETYDPDKKNPVISSSLVKGIKPSKEYINNTLFLFLFFYLKHNRV